MRSQREGNRLEMFSGPAMCEMVDGTGVGGRGEAGIKEVRGGRVEVFPGMCGGKG